MRRDLPPPRREIPPATAETGTAYVPSLGARAAADRWPDGRVVAHCNGTWREADAETFRPDGDPHG